MVETNTDTSEAARTLRRRVYLLLERASRRSLPARTFDTGMVLLILANVLVAIVATVPGLTAADMRALTLFDRACVAVFALEYAARLWTAPEQPLLARLAPGRARLRFAATPLMIVDALAILPLAAELIFPAVPQIVLLRLVRFLKVARYSTALPTIGRVLADIRRQILACLILFAGLVIAAAAVMMAIEGRVQPDRFGDMPSALWWAVVLLTKLGQTDVVPATLAGKLVAVVMMLAGIGFIALPVGIIGRAFYDEIRRRDFVVTFGMVARVPLLARLDPATIAELVALLRSRKVAPGTVLMRRGDPGDAMYFISEGAVEVVADGSTLRRLEAGEYFGEMALLSRGPRTATVKTVTATDLLVLEASDFERLLQANPAIEEAVRRTASVRAGELPRNTPPQRGKAP
jgi:voltage-gated potassium channel